MFDALEADYREDLRREDQYRRKIERHKTEHWHPHDPDYIDEEFEVLEDGDTYCRGIVFALSEVAEVQL